MKVFITNDQLLQFAMDKLDLCRPNPDRIHEIAERCGFLYNEDLDMFEDVEDNFSVVRAKGLPVVIQKTT